MKLSGLNIFREYGENLKLNPVLALVLVLNNNDCLLRLIAVINRMAELQSHLQNL